VVLTQNALGAVFLKAGMRQFPAEEEIEVECRGDGRTLSKSTSAQVRQAAISSAFVALCEIEIESANKDR